MTVAFPDTPIPWNDGITNQPTPAFLAYMKDLEARVLLLEASGSTGDAKFTLKTTADTGWVIMNDGSVGSATSGSTTRANADTAALFALLFNNISDANAPILTSSGAATTRAAQVSATLAFAANCRMSLTKQLGRSLAVAGAGSGLTTRTLGSGAGAETETPTLAKTAAHTHTTAHYANTSGDISLVAGAGVDTFRGTPTDFAGSGTPLNILDPSAYWNVMIKL